MADFISSDLAKAIVELKKVQDAITDFYRTKSKRDQESYEGKKEITRLRFRFDQETLKVASQLIAELGEVAVEKYSEDSNKVEEFVHWTF